MNIAQFFGTAFLWSTSGTASDADKYVTTRVLVSGKTSGTCLGKGVR